MASLLDSLLNDPKTQIVLDAEEWRKTKKGPSKSADGPAYFHATAGHYQSKFVSIHRLFEMPEASDNVLKELADAANNLKNVFGFNAILACTVTAKMLMERLHAQLESTPDELATFYLGNFPFVNPESQGPINLSGRRVLILTDVIASGTTVRKLCDTVRQCHGEALVVLTAVLTDPSLKDPKVDGEGKIDDVTLRYLSEYKIERKDLVDLPENIFEIEIDALTVMPKMEPSASNGYHPAVETINAISHFKNSESLRTGFFQRDSRRMTSVIRFDKLLKYCDSSSGTNPTWQAVQPLIDELHAGPDGKRDDDPWILATTFNENDIAFARFVNDKLPENARPARTLYIPRTDTLQFHNRYFLPEEKARLAKSAKILLVLSSCNTGEKVTNLASLLAGHSARRIHVVCLVNRLGSETADFMRRVETLINGSPNNRIRFSFKSTYDLPDFSQTELSQLTLTIENLASHYCEHTRVLGFRRWMEHEQKYFKFHGMTGKRFLGEPPENDPDAVQRATEEFQLDMALFCSQRRLFDERNGNSAPDAQNGKASTHPNIQPLLDLICAPHTPEKPFGPRSVVEKGTLYKLYALFISQIHLLKQMRQFSAVRNCLIELIRQLRNHRFELERSTVDNGNDTPELVAEIRDCIDREVQLWFGLALLSLNDSDDHEGQPTYGDLMVEALTCGRSSPAEWTATPRNMVYYFSDDMVMWASSLLVVFLGRYDELFIQTVHDYCDAFEELIPKSAQLPLESLKPLENTPKTKKKQTKHNKAIPDAPEKLRLDLAFLEPNESGMRPMQARFRIQNNFDLLLTELTKHKATQNYEVITFLQSRIIFTGKDHNPITSAVNQALRTIRKDVEDRKLPIRDFFNQPTNGTPQPQEFAAVVLPQGSKRRKLQSVLEEAIYATSALEEIAVALPEFFRFTSAKREDITRYVDTDLPCCFASDVREMAGAFERMRRDNRVSSADYISTETAWKRIEYDMYNDKSLLRKSLLEYIVLFDAPTSKNEADGSRPPVTDKDHARLSPIPVVDNGNVRKPLLPYAIELALTTLERRAATASGEEKKKEQCFLRGLKRIWKSHRAPKAAQFVLVDYWVAIEVLKNLLTNVRHAYEKATVDAIPKDLMQIEVNADSTDNILAVTFSYFGKAFPDRELPSSARSSTLSRHRVEIEQFGGGLNWGNSPNNSGTWIRVEFVTRQIQASSH